MCNLKYQKMQNTLLEYSPRGFSVSNYQKTYVNLKVLSKTIIKNVKNYRQFQLGVDTWHKNMI